MCNRFQGYFLAYFITYMLIAELNSSSMTKTYRITKVSGHSRNCLRLIGLFAARTGCFFLSFYSRKIKKTKMREKNPNPAFFNSAQQL